ncbi:GAF domain-containing protein [Desulfopila sp. IMCC35006]|uniref:GAF domain-containing protein n=1 Tax=Desulfopila sp. IMCC35006 TaxID=2569542 RepID=UPI0010AC8D85|nr:GAF domain-containing protein [Desulfopila sp. IMCC35006]TKB24776.1 GAF domain-containing protein [Desulfopila sp. IMCC35006]
MHIDDSHKEGDFLKVFQEVTRLISMVHDPQQVMDLVVRRLPGLLEVDAATIRLLDSGTNTFVLGAAWGVSDEYLSRSTIDSKEVMAALLQGQPTARTGIDVICDHDSCAYMSREGVKSAMSLPILYKGQVIGLLRLLTKDTRQFTEAEIAFAMSLAEQVGMTIANGRMFQEMENQVQFFRELRVISRLVNSTLDLDLILKTVVDKLPGIMGVKGCTIRLLHPATNRLELVAASGVSREYLDRGSISREDSIFKVLKGEPVAIYDAPNDPRVDYHEAIEKEGIKSILAIPISNEQEIIGVLRLLTGEHHCFTPMEINFAVTVAEEGGNAIEKARTYRKITLLFNQIEEHERFLQTILDSLWMQLLVVDPDKRVIMVNKHFLETKNCTEAETLGRHYRTISPWSSDDTTECPVSTVLVSRKPITVLHRLDEDGSDSKWFEHHLAPILDNDGKVSFVVEAVRDITDQRLLEQEKMERMKLQGVIEMAGTAAHELNSPLFAALGTAQLLRDDLESEEMIAEMDTIIRNLQKMSTLTRQMTSVTGFESREYVGETKIVQLK